MATIAFDTETFLIERANLAPALVCGSFAPGGVFDRETTIERIRYHLTHSHNIVGHNIAFDMAVICAADSSLVPLVFRAYSHRRIACTQIRERLLDIRHGCLDTHVYTLEWLVQHHLHHTVEGKHGPDVWRLRYSELADLPIDEWPEDAVQYSLNDAKLTRRVWEKQGPRIPSERDLASTAFALHLQSCWGIRTNSQYVETLKAKLEADVRGFDEFAKALGIMDSYGHLKIKALEKLIIGAYEGNPPRNEPTEKMLAKGITEGSISRSGLTLVTSGNADLIRVGLALRPKHH